MRLALGLGFSAHSFFIDAEVFKEIVVSKHLLKKVNVCFVIRKVRREGHIS